MAKATFNQAALSSPKVAAVFIANSRLLIISLYKCSLRSGLPTARVFGETEENAGNRRFALHYKIYSGIIREKLSSEVKTMSKKLVAYSRRG